MQLWFVLIAVILQWTACAHENKVVLITGSSRGLGLAAARRLTAEGFTVYGVARSAPLSGDESFYFAELDLLDSGALQAFVHGVIEKEGRIDVLINNAGYALVGPVESLSRQEIQDQMEVNFLAPIQLIQEVLPSMRKQKSGHIINISSTNAFQTPPFGSIYSASKAALENLSEALAVELQPYGISVSIVEPGFIQTHFALPIGTRNVPDNPYQKILSDMSSAIQERLAHPENLSPSQTPEEVADFLFHVIQDPSPKLRYQTSDAAREDVSQKLLDLTGDLYLEEMRKFFR